MTLSLSTIYPSYYIFIVKNIICRFNTTYLLLLSTQKHRNKGCKEINRTKREKDFKLKILIFLLFLIVYKKVEIFILKYIEIFME